MSDVIPAGDAPRKLEPQTREKDQQPETLGSFLGFVVKLALAVVIFRTFMFSPFNIPSESMLPRLMNGDYLVASKWSYGFSQYSFWPTSPPFGGRLLASEPERGDVVIFKHPVDEVDYIKRVIALPGDTIEVRKGVPVLNGEPLRREGMEDFIVRVSPNTACAWGGRATRDAQGAAICRYSRFRETLPGGRNYTVLDFGILEQDEFEATIVPEGTMFVMGDNRDNSQDSRFPAQSGGGVGIVPQDLLVGEAQMIVWSTDGSAAWLKPWTWFTAARWDRMGNAL